MKKYRAVRGALMTSFGRERYLVRARKLDRGGENTVIGMNGIAAFYWEQLSEPATEDGLFAKMAAEYSVSDAEKARADLSGLLKSWLGAGYIEEIAE